jgi:hypothetical protein
MFPAGSCVVGVLSISQPEARASQRECPGFVGFYGVFLEIRKPGLAALVYRLSMGDCIPLQVVASGQLKHRSPEFE